jgi:GNAT superfamily N-acetyltransferase
LVALFEAAACPCYCRWWHFAGDDNAWQLRAGASHDANRSELEQAVAAGSMPGIVALQDERVIGWLKLAPVDTVPKMFARRFYRGLPWFHGDRSGVVVIGCLLVHPGARRRGVARALIAAAIEAAAEQRATAIEALPRRVAEPAHDDALWLGPIDSYRSLGFRIVAGTDDHPVMRIDL